MPILKESTKKEMTNELLEAKKNGLIKTQIAYKSSEMKDWFKGRSYVTIGKFLKKCSEEVLNIVGGILSVPKKRETVKEFEKLKLIVVQCIYHNHTGYAFVKKRGDMFPGENRINVDKLKEATRKNALRQGVRKRLARDKGKNTKTENNSYAEAGRVMKKMIEKCDIDDFDDIEENINTIKSTTELGIEALNTIKSTTELGIEALNIAFKNKQIEANKFYHAKEITRKMIEINKDLYTIERSFYTAFSAHIETLNGKKIPSKKSRYNLKLVINGKRIRCFRMLERGHQQQYIFSDGSKSIKEIKALQKIFIRESENKKKERAHKHSRRITTAKTRERRLKWNKEIVTPIVKKIEDGTIKINDIYSTNEIAKFINFDKAPHVLGMALLKFSMMDRIKAEKWSESDKEIFSMFEKYGYEMKTKKRKNCPAVFTFRKIDNNRSKETTTQAQKQNTTVQKVDKGAQFLKLYDDLEASTKNTEETEETEEVPEDDYDIRMIKTDLGFVLLVGGHEIVPAQGSRIKIVEQGSNSVITSGKLKIIIGHKMET